MERQTIIFTSLPNGLAPDGALLLSVFISPRLWSDDPTLGKLKLAKFPDFLDWTTRVGAATWKVAFEGGPTLNATVESAAPSAVLWNALFKNDADVIPFRFDDYRGAIIETFPSDLIHDFLVGVYSRAASDPTFELGRDLPPIETLAADPDLIDIARASHPEPPFKPPPRPAPIDLGGTLPQPDPEPSKPKAGCGCMMWPLALLVRLFPKLKPCFDKLFGGALSSEPAPTPVFPVEPMPVPPPPAPPQPDPPVDTSGPLFEPPGGPPSANRSAFDKLGHFVTPPTEVSQSLPTEAEVREKYDFHQMFAALGDYPLLLRSFGVVVDLRVSLNGANPPNAGAVKVEPTIALTGVSTIVTPRTHYELAADIFSAQPRPVDPEISNGLLRLNDTNLFRVIQVDVVGSGVKIRNAATNTLAYREKKNRAANMPDNTGLPALRTGGISIIRRNLVNELRSRFGRSHALQRMVFALDNAPQPADPPDAGAPEAPTDELFAEDLVRGYRVDVFDLKSNAWHSLCQRVGKYDFLDAPAAPGGKISLSLEDEGFVQFGATEPLAKPAKRTLRSSDSLFAWDGWSLCAPRPGLSIMSEPDPPPHTPGAPVPPPAKTKLEAVKNKAVTSFQLETEFSAAIGSLPRLRFDYKYRLRARVCDLAGNSVFGPDVAKFADDVTERTADFPCARYEPVSPPPMMLRAAPVEGESLERLVVRTPPVGFESQTTERHIVPPKVSQLMAEQHGKFDGVPQMDGTNTGYDLAAREAGAINDDATEVKKDVWVHPAPQFKVKYLPDPSSRGALVLGLPGLLPEEIIEPTAVKIVNKIPFDGAWPDPKPFRLRLVAIAAGVAPAEPQWNSVDRVLVVELPEAGQKVVRLSSYFEKDDLDRQGVLQWTRGEAPATLLQVEAETLAGRSWLHLPWREITLVHAVQQPLGPPNAVVVSPAGKQLGQTFATITGKIKAHSASTGKVDLLAKWEDPIDDSALPAPTTQQQKTHLCEVMIAADAVDTEIRDSAKHQFPKHNFGDTKFHSVTYLPVATTRFREYFPESITTDAANLSLAGPQSAPVLILNSARPDAPKVLYVVPTYEWEDDLPTPGKATRKRKGGGLRVYLDRGWYSSGDGELLGVVCIEGEQFTSLDEKAKAVVTKWGADPIWLTTATATAATRDNFKGTTKKQDGLRLEEIAQPVFVAGYKPEFDAERRLWFADIEIDAGISYGPLVRLALARYQPNSVKDAELSRVVRADFAQLAPDRTASVTTTAAPGSANFKILVKGLTYQASSATVPGFDVFGRPSHSTGGRAEIEALLQRRNPAVSDPDLGWDTKASILLTPDAVNLGEWTGQMNILENLNPDTWRILLQEYEWYRSDFQPENVRENMTFARRIVYAAAIRLG